MQSKKTVVKLCCLMAVMAATLSAREARANYVQLGVDTFTEWGDPIIATVPDQQGNTAKTESPIHVEVGATGSSSAALTGAQKSLSAGLDVASNNSYGRASVGMTSGIMSALWVWQGQGAPTPFRVNLSGASVEINARAALGTAGGATSIQGNQDVYLSTGNYDYDAGSDDAYGSESILLGDASYAGVPVNYSDVRPNTSKTLSSIVTGARSVFATASMQVELDSTCNGPSASASATQNLSIGSFSVQ